MLEKVMPIALPRTHPLKRKEQLAMMEKLLKSVEKKTKCVSITHMTKPMPIEYISTGLARFDDVISGARDDDGMIIDNTGHGLPKGRIIEIYGGEASAKTALALLICARAQMLGGLVAFIDMEHALDMAFATKMMGIDPKTFAMYRPVTGNEAIQIVIAAIKSKVDVVVVDSVSSLLSEEELSGSRAKGLQARLMSESCRKISAMLDDGGPLVIFINQTRHKISIGGPVFGNPETTSGGNALKFYASVRLRLEHIKALTKLFHGERVTVGHRMKMRVVKNKVAPDGGRCQFEIIFGRGFRLVDEVKERKSKNKKGAAKEETEE